MSNRSVCQGPYTKWLRNSQRLRLSSEHWGQVLGWQAQSRRYITPGHRVPAHPAVQSRLREVLGMGGRGGGRALQDDWSSQASWLPKESDLCGRLRSGSETAQDIPCCWNTSLFRVKLCSCLYNVISPLPSFIMPQNEPAPGEINDACSVGSMQALAWESAAPKPPSPSVKVGKLTS